MSKYYKQKGAQFERDVRDYLISRGWGAKKVAGSGAVEGYPGDVEAVSPTGLEVLIQTKWYKKANGYGRLFAKSTEWPQGFHIGERWIAGKADVILSYLEGQPLPVNMPCYDIVTESANRAVKRAGETLLIVKQNRTPGWLALARPILFRAQLQELPALPRRQERGVASIAAE